ncbi:MAG: translocation/assembly module TamB domain-containing protein [Armatimonadia bacterium]
MGSLIAHPALPSSPISIARTRPQYEMLTRLSRHLFLLVLALALVIIAGVLVIVRESDWAHRRLQQAVTRQLVDLLDREVAVGPVTGDPLTGLTIHGLAIAEGKRLSGGAIITAGRVVIKYDFASLVSGRLAPIASISEVNVYRANARIIRDAQGRLNLTGLLPPARRVPPEKRFRGRLFVHDSALAYLDYGSFVKTPPLRVHVIDVQGQADLRQVTRLVANLSARVADGKAESLSAKLVTELERPYFDLSARLVGVNAAWAHTTFGFVRGLSITSGRADITGSIYQVPIEGKPKLDFSVNAALSGVTGRYRDLGPEPVHVDGAVWASLAGGRASNLRATWAGSIYDLRGSMSNWSKPTFDVSLTSAHARLSPIVNFLPAKTRRGLSIPASGFGSVVASVVGPPDNADLRLKLGLQDGLSIRLPNLGLVQADRLQLAADVVSTARPSVRATLSGRRLVVPNIKPAGKGWPRRLTIAPLSPFAASVQWCGGQPVAEATLRAPAVTADNLRLANLRTRATIVDGVARLQNIQAQALGGRLNAEASLRFRGGPPTVRTRGSITGLDLARLKELPLNLRDTVNGSANLDFQAHMRDQRFAGIFGLSAANIIVRNTIIQGLKGTFGLERGAALHGVGRFTATGAKQEDLQANQAEALVELTGNRLYILSGSWQGPDGLFWASGDINLDTEQADLQASGAELAMRPLSHMIGLRDFAGTGYLSGRVVGTPSAPTFLGRLTVFKPEASEYVFDAFTANVTYRPPFLAAKDLLLSRGSMIISGDASLANLGAPAAQMPISGTLNGQSISLADLPDLLQKDWPVTGLAEFTAKIGGSLARPSASGTLRLANASYKELVVNSASVPYTYSGNDLHFEGAQAVLFDAPVTATGTLVLSEPPNLDATLTVGQVALQGLAPLLGEDFPMAGMVSIPEIKVSGPLDKLQGQGRLVGTDLELGGETVQNVNTAISLASGQVQLEKTTLGLAGGQVVVSGAYDYATHPHTVNAQLDLRNADIPDLIYLALPIIQLADDRPQRERADTRLEMRSLALRLKGNLTGDLNLTGTVAHPTAVANLKGRNLVLDDRKLPDLDGRGNVSRTALTNLAVELRQGQALVTINGDLAYKGDLKLEVFGSAIELAQLRPWIPLDVAYGGRLGFGIGAEGQTRSPHLVMSVDVVDPTFAGVKFDLLNVPTIDVQEGKINIDTGALIRQKQEVVVNGTLPFSWGAKPGSRLGLDPKGELNLGGKVADTQLAFFLPLIDEYLRAHAQGAEPTFRWGNMTSTGTVSATYSVTGTPPNPVINGNLKLADGSLAPPGWDHPVTGLQADLVFTGSGAENLVQVKALTGAYETFTPSLTGRMWLDKLGLPRFWQNRFDLDLALTAGALDLPGGSRLAGLNGGLTFRTEDGAQVLRPRDNLGFTLGGGRVTMEGEARLKNFYVPELASNFYDLTLNVPGSRVLYRNYVNALLAGKLQIVTPPSAKPKAEIRGGLALSDGMVGLIMPAAGGAGGMHALSSAAPSPLLNFTLDLGKRMALRGSGVTLQLEPEEKTVAITGTPQAPTLVASLHSRTGTTTLPTASFHIEQLDVNRFTVSPVPGGDPQRLTAGGEISGVAYTSISRPGDRPIRVRADISGRLPDAVKISTSSDPELTEAQIYALVGGVPFAYLPGMGTRDPNLGDVVSEQFLATLANAFRLRVFQPIEEQLKGLLGLDELGISFAFDQPISLQVGKYLVQNLLVSYERPLADNAEQYDLRVSYQLPGGLRITYHNDERNDNRVEIGYTFTF